LIRALILSGGFSHDFASSSTALARITAAGGISAEIETDVDAAMARLGAYDVLVFNTLRWRMTNDESFAGVRSEWGFETNPALRDGVAAHLASGRGIYALHAACICFDDWPEWKHILGASWQWDVSGHQSVGLAHISFAEGHPLTEGLDDFEVIDEVYGGLALAEDARPLAWAAQEVSTTRHPILFARDVGAGRLVYDVLGHDSRSIEHPGHAQLIRRGIRWAAKLPVEEGGSDQSDPPNS
jgi:type 1 glutamine amidotransferase